MTAAHISSMTTSNHGDVLTNKRQPNKLQTNQRNNSKHDPQHRLCIQRQPEEPLICRIDISCLRVRRFKHPSSISGISIGFVPPSQPYQPSTRDVFEVVEVNGKQQDRDDEDEDEVGGEQAEAKDID